MGCLKRALLCPPLLQMLPAAALCMPAAPSQIGMSCSQCSSGDCAPARLSMLMQSCVACSLIRSKHRGGPSSSKSLCHWPHQWSSGSSGPELTCSYQHALQRGGVSERWA